MSIVSLTKFNAKLAAPLRPSDTVMTLRITKTWLDALNSIADGNTLYLMLDYYDRFEFVRFDKQGAIQASGGAIKLLVDRAQFGTSAQSWPTGNCVRYELTGEILSAVLTEQCKL